MCDFFRGRIMRSTLNFFGEVETDQVLPEAKRDGAGRHIKRIAALFRSHGNCIDDRYRPWHVYRRDKHAETSIPLRTHDAAIIWLSYLEYLFCVPCQSMQDKLPWIQRYLFRWLLLLCECLVFGLHYSLRQSALVSPAYDHSIDIRVTNGTKACGLHLLARFTFRPVSTPWNGNTVLDTDLLETDVRYTKLRGHLYHGALPYKIV